MFNSFSKLTFLKLQQFILPCTYTVNSIFLVKVRICKIHVLMTCFFATVTMITKRCLFLVSMSTTVKATNSSSTVQLCSLSSKPLLKKNSAKKIKNGLYQKVLWPTKVLWPLSRPFKWYVAWCPKFATAKARYRYFFFGKNCLK